MGTHRPSISGLVAHMIWLTSTSRPYDPACFSTVMMTGDLRWDGSMVLAEEVRKIH